MNDLLSIIKDLQTHGLSILTFNNQHYILYGKNLWNTLHSFSQAINIKSYNSQLKAAYNTRSIACEVLPMPSFGRATASYLRLWAAIHQSWLEHSGKQVLSRMPAKLSTATAIVVFGGHYSVRLFVHYGTSKFLVGLFSTMPEAVAFEKEHYGQGVNSLVVCLNAQTRAYLQHDRKYSHDLVG